MDMDQAAVWLAGSILFALGAVVLVGAVIVINNMIHNYWKPVKMISWSYPPTRFAEQHELDKSIEPK